MKNKEMNKIVRRVWSKNYKEVRKAALKSPRLKRLWDKMHTKVDFVLVRNMDARERDLSDLSVIITHPEIMDQFYDLDLSTEDATVMRAAFRDQKEDSLQTAIAKQTAMAEFTKSGYMYGTDFSNIRPRLRKEQQAMVDDLTERKFECPM